MTGFTGYDADNVANQSGNYLALTFTSNPWPDSLKVSFTGKEPVTIESDSTAIVFRVTDPKAQKIQVEMTKGEDTRSKEYSLEGLDLLAAVKATGVTVTPETASVEVNKTVKLSATVQPNDATTKDVAWSSDKANIATVNNTGLVTGKAAGTANITATSADGTNLSDKCVVTVTAPAGA